MAGKAAMAAGLALAAAAAGFAGGWVAGRATIPPPPPPEVFLNPLADARKGESIVLVTPDGTREQYLVEEAAGDSVLLSIRTSVAGSPDALRQMRVARTYPGFFIQIEGDLDPRDSAAAVRNFVVQSMEPADLRLEALDRTVHCWRIRGTFRGGDLRTYWISSEFPVHGLLRADGPRGKVWEIDAYQEVR